MQGAHVCETAMQTTGNTAKAHGLHYVRLRACPPGSAQLGSIPRATSHHPRDLGQLTYRPCASFPNLSQKSMTAPIP